MRFLKTDSFNNPSDDVVLDFFETPAEDVSYAIFSHTWDLDEVLFLDVVNGTAHERNGFRKTCSAVWQAAHDGYDYIWIDNCCINKDSSAELSEAINSMFRWYQKADVCYAYLTDVPPADIGFEFSTSRWFTRGWTLQELLAPQKLQFFSNTWQLLGDRDSLKPMIASVTSIDEKFLDGRVPLQAASIAERMSWASERVTTRPEDIAYSLMGIFSVNMPMLYGEGGKRAFLRLQEEIMKISGDQSLFAWTDPDMRASDRHGLLADRPRAFRRSGSFTAYDSVDERNIFVMTSLGLRIRLHLLPSVDSDFVSAALMCPHPHSMGSFLALRLRKLPEGDNQYVRIECGDLFAGKESWPARECYVRQVNVVSTDQVSKRQDFLQVCVRTHSALPAGVAVRTAYVADHNFTDLPFPSPMKRPDYETLTDPPVLAVKRGSNALAVTLNILRPLQQSLTLMLGSRMYRPTAAIGMCILPNPGLKPIQEREYQPVSIRTSKAITTIGKDDLMFINYFERHTLEGVLWVVDLVVRRDPQLPDLVELAPTPHSVTFDRFARKLGTCFGLAA